MIMMSLLFLDLKRLDRGGNLLLRPWGPPECGKLKLNLDGSYRASENCMGGGSVARDEGGSWLFEFHSYETGGSAFQAEVMALRDWVLSIPYSSFSLY